MKKKIIRFVSLLLLFSLFGCSAKRDITGDETDFVTECIVYPKDIQEAIEENDVIVLGKVLNTDFFQFQDPELASTGQDHWYSSTVASFLVEEIFKGDVKKGDTLVVGQSGDGITEAYSSIYNGCGYLQKNDYCLLFLEKSDSAEDISTLLKYGNLKAIFYLWKDLYIVSSTLSVKLDENGNILKQNEITADIIFDNAKTLQEIREKLN